METILNWKKGLFKSIYEIYSDNLLVGYLNEKTWTESSHGELYGERFIFKTKGIFHQETQVFNNENNTPLGKISYNPWMTKAKIEYSDKIYFWKFDNLWSISWRLYNDEGLQIRYYRSSSKGKIEYDLENNFLVITGLYINNYYWQTSVVILMTVFLPLWLAVFN
jgi:hypothetical protein